MRKFVFSLVIFLTSVSAFAGVVTMSQAENVAKNVLGASSVQYVWNGLGDKVYGDVYPAFYVFDGNGQWAIIAADDCATPVLMHGEGTFDLDKVPANMLSLLGDVEQNIFTARHQKLAQAPEIKKAWSNYSVVTKAGGYSPVAKFVIDKEGNAGTALWNQGSPYNLKCPAILNESDYSRYNNEGHCYAGCVAAAMAIIMRFHEWPEYGEGIIPGYTEGDYTVPDINIEGYEYNWADLPITDAWDTYYNSYNEWSKQQIGRVGDILFQCGAMVNMDYGAFGSGAISVYALDALQNYMSYSKDAKHLSRSNYTNQQWYNMIKAELDANRPLFYHGQDKGGQGGHAFVCDGYNSNNEVHINWGWGGLYYDTSWFAVCYLGPASGELDDAVYSSSDGAFFGLVPDKTGVDPVDDPELPGLIVDPDYSAGITLVSGTIAKNSQFTLNLSSIWNIGDGSYTGSLRAALLDKDGNIKEFISDAMSFTLGQYSYRTVISNFDCIFTSSVVFGDYISIMCSYGDGKWAPIDKYWADYSNPVIKLYLIDIALIDIPSTFTTGQICYPSLVFAQKAPSTITWYLDGEEFTAEYIKMTAGDHTFKAVIKYTDNSTETIVKKVTVE